NLLMHVARGVSSEVGEAFFRSLVEHLARELGADFAFLGELVGTKQDQVRTLAWLVDGTILHNPDHPLEGSMSAHTLAAARTVVYPSGVREMFAHNAELRKDGVEAYVGVPLMGADGAPLGVLAVGHRKPIERSRLWASMIEIFGARAAAEIERARADELVRRMNASLELP